MYYFIHIIEGLNNNIDNILILRLDILGNRVPLKQV